jgi:hypothetical protein
MNPIEELTQFYPEVIEQMPERFNAHEFILELAHQHQSFYIQALAQYVDSQRPFKIVHGQLASALHQFDDLIYHIGDESNTNIFGRTSDASVWGKK